MEGEGDRPDYGLHRLDSGLSSELQGSESICMQVTDLYIHVGK